ncbi:hypothetical protein GCM10023067_30560 [Aminobacter aganoensis]
MGEAVSGSRSQRFRDMISIASAIKNRMDRLGVDVSSVISAPGQFDAYGKQLPRGTEAHRALAKEAWNYVNTAGPVHAGMFYSTPSTKGNLPKGLSQISKTTGHIFFEDPQGRTIRTAAGYRQPTAINPAGPQRPSISVPPTTAAERAGLRTAAFPAYEPVSRPSVDVGPRGLETLAPNGLRSTPEMYGMDVLGDQQPALRSNLADVSYNMGPHRPNKPNQTTIDIARSAVRDVLGPGYSVDVISGQENRGHQHGSNRHKTGLAADIQIKDPNGKLLTATANAQQMTDVAQAMAAKGAKGIGFGTDYMAAKGLHVDQFTPGPGQDYEWGNLGNANKELLADARNTGVMPASFYEKSLPQSMHAPQPRTPDTLMAAPLGTVERSPLPSLSLVTSAQAAPMPNRPASPSMDTMRGLGSVALPSFNSPRMTAPALKTPTQSLSRLPASPSPERFGYTLASAPAMRGRPPVAPMGSMNNIPRGNFAPAAAPAAPNAKMSLAQQYASYGAGRVPNPTPAINAMMSPTVGPITQTGLLPPSAVVPNFVPATPPPAPVTAPKMPRVMTPTQRVDQAFQTASVPEPQFTAADVYAGRANSGAATGGNTVSRDQFGNISVTNKYGATTTTNANGQQMASSGPGIAGPISGQGVQTPSVPSNLGGKIRGGLGTVVGGGLGGFLAGPVGAALGAVVAGDLAKGKNPLDRLGIGTFGMPVTDQFGFTQQMRFANPKSGGPFPNAPAGVRGALGGRESNLTDRQMRDISPRAADAISKGKGGLY